MDNVFSQILIREIENLNLVYAQYKVAKLKWETLKNTKESDNQKEQLTDIIKYSQDALDSLRISIIQISMRARTIAKDVRLSPEQQKQLTEFEEKIMQPSAVEPKDFADFVQIANKIYVENILETKFKNTAQSVSELTGR